MKIIPMDCYSWSAPFDKRKLPFFQIFTRDLCCQKFHSSAQPKIHPKNHRFMRNRLKSVFQKSPFISESLHLYTKSQHRLYSKLTHLSHAHRQKDGSGRRRLQLFTLKITLASCTHSTRENRADVVKWQQTRTHCYLPLSIYQHFHRKRGRAFCFHRVAVWNWVGLSRASPRALLSLTSIILLIPVPFPGAQE